MKMLIGKYIQAMDLRWSDSTKKSEASRLDSVAGALDGKPETLWAETRRLAPYSRTTTWTRVVALVDWAIESGHLSAPNHYRIFRKQNIKQFKNTYQRRIPKLSFEEAVARIDQLPDLATREKALQLIFSGMRWTESFTYQDGWVIGKGGKERRIPYTPASTLQPFAGSYSKAYRALKKLGLKPHDLRKLALKKYVQSGATAVQLCRLAGWASFATAQSYIEATDSELEKLHAEAFK